MALRDHAGVCRIAISRWLGSGRKLALVLLATVVASCSGPPREARPPSPQLDRPNILLLVAEDMSPRVGSFGDPVARTPTLDALAAEGTRFPNTFTTAGVCAPSRAAQITGMHQNALGAGHMRTSTYPDGGYAAVPPPWVKGYPELLRAAGYYTFNSGKTDYQLSDSMLADQSPRTIWDESRVPGALDWESAPLDKPFFGMINFHTTHESGLFPELAWPESTTHALIMMVNLFGARGAESITRPEDVDLPPYYPDTALARETVARQYDNIHLMDQQVGEILDQLRRDGLEESTIVIWTTDHGSGLPGAKRELSDAGIRVPLIIRWPQRFRPAGVVPGEVEQRMVSFVDLAPTILAMARVPIPKWMVGRVFAGEEPADPREFVFAARDRLDEYPDRSRAVRSDRFKYIRNWNPGQPAGFDLEFRRIIPFMKQWRTMWEKGELDATQARFFEPRGPEELYDLQVDPWETENLVDDPRYAAVADRMRMALDEWLTTSDDLGAIPEDEMIERFRPGGTTPTTAVPIIEFSGDPGSPIVSLKHPDSYVSLGLRRSGGPRPGKWELYRNPVSIDPGETVTAFAVRYGWLESPEVERVAGTNAP